MKHLSFCVIILAVISVSAQVQPESPRKQKPQHKATNVVDTAHFDTIINAHNEMQKILRAEMQLAEPQ